MDEQKSITIKLASSAEDVSKEDWDRLANPAADPSAEFDYNPFLSHAFYTAVENSGSACRHTGWLPQHLVMEQGGEVTGIIPCYLKNHSQGEYVFDHGWADAFERAGGAYYPKLQATVPFTPASGRRLLVGNGPDAAKRRLLLAGGLQQACEQLEVSSAHITFMLENEWKLLGDHRYLRRNDQQFHWLNDGYDSFDDFLAVLSSRKRKNIKKERKAALYGNGISVEWLTGDQLTEDIWDIFFQFYTDTGSRKWGQPYLTREFYSMIGKSMADDVVLVMAKRDGRYVAGAINFVGSHTLFGRHWGCVEDHPFLHFEICYYQAIDYAITHGLARVEAGAQGSHKLARGYMPQMTYSAHYITHPDFRHAVEDYLERERAAVERENRAIADHGPFKKENSNDGL
ncbi:MAG: GNAT family N-acetyltransferase [Rhizobiaceae bacterium]|nr:GNAT family N-acetyltransferase [Rhizobiaceae bacterium]